MKALRQYKFIYKAGPQILFWLCYFLFSWLNLALFTHDYEYSFLSIIKTFPVYILASYWHLEVTVRYFLLKSNILGFVLSLIGGIIAFGIIQRALISEWHSPLYYLNAFTKPLSYWRRLFGPGAIMQLHLAIMLFIAFELVRHALSQQRLNEVYKREKLAAEYQLLQSQVQPHFLFNTLNNLTSVSINQPAQMPVLMQRLAGLLSYQIHESHRATVKVKKEIEYLIDYIALEKIRYGNRLDVQTNFSELGSLNDLMIPPMLLLPFVENAFKHGAAQSENKCWIQLHLSKSGNRLIFSAENSVPEEKNSLAKSGLGLANLKKRLDILFPENYELVTLLEDGQFLAVLKFIPESMAINSMPEYTQRKEVYLA